jgi:hypothetical protein
MTQNLFKDGLSVWYESFLLSPKKVKYSFQGTVLSVNEIKITLELLTRLKIFSCKKSVKSDYRIYNLNVNLNENSLKVFLTNLEVINLFWLFSFSPGSTRTDCRVRKAVQGHRSLSGGVVRLIDL